MADNFKLPGSSYDELVKIIKAYSTAKNGQPLSLETIAQSTGMDKTVVSRNNGFLVQSAIISEGNKKAPSELGIDLGRAYNLKMEDQIARIWASVVTNNEFLTRMLSAVRIRNGMEKGSFINHILYSSGSATNNNTKAGANTIIEIFKTSKLVAEIDGKISACDVNDDTIEVCNDNIPSNSEIEYPAISSSQVLKSGINVTININIEVNSDQLEGLSGRIKALLNDIRE